jgi:hypothetical protein
MNADDAYEALITDSAALIADVQAQRAEIAREREALERRGAERLAEVEDARRRGEHGRDWQVLQQRIDLHETTMFDIENGLDHTAEARAVRKVMGEHYALIRQSYRSQLAEPDEERAADLARLAEARETLSREVARLEALEGDNR